MAIAVALFITRIFIPSRSAGVRIGFERSQCDQRVLQAAAHEDEAGVGDIQQTVDFVEEYGYVYTDLRRVAVIAAAMVVILVVLAFVIT